MKIVYWYIILVYTRDELIIYKNTLWQKKVSEKKSTLFNFGASLQQSSEKKNDVNIELFPRKLYEIRRICIIIFC